MIRAPEGRATNTLGSEGWGGGRKNAYAWVQLQFIRRTHPGRAAQSARKEWSEPSQTVEKE